MSLVLFANNASTTLAAPITNAATSVSVASGQGALFPNPASGQYFRATLVKNGSPGTFEIVKVTAAASDTFTIARAQEGTTALPWAEGDYFNLFVTAEDLAAFAQIDDLQAQGGGYAADTGVANANAVSLTPALTQHILGMPIRWRAAQSNTGACTFSDGVGALANVTPEGAALVQGDIVAGGIYVTVYDGTRFQTVTVHRTNFSQLTGTASAAQIPTLDASKIGTGTVVTARLGSGTANSSVVLHGDSTWGAVSGSQVSGAVSESNTVASNGSYATFYWSAQSGQPSYLWGSNDGDNFYPWNPSNFSVANAAECGGFSPSASAFGSTIAVRDSSGGISAVYFNSSSDERLKSDIAPIEDALAIVCELAGVTFRWRSDGTFSAGFIAQRLLETPLAHLVSAGENGFLGVNYAGVVPYLAEALKTERAARESCEQRLAAIERRLGIDPGRSEAF